MKRRDRGIPPVREWSLIPPIVTAETMMAILEDRRSHFDELLAAGMPHLNLGNGRERRMLRFEPDRVIAWLRERGGAR
jgi:hypothetical protein